MQIELERNLDSERSTEILNRFKDGASKVSDGDPLIIAYGSIVDGVATSDLDVAFIFESVTPELKANLIDYTIDFHRKNALRLDNEVPYENKLVYETSDLTRALQATCFEMRDDSIFIPPVKKTPAFLGSEDIKDRLLLNLLTSRNNLISGDFESYKDLRGKAWSVVIGCIFSHNRNALKTPEEFIPNLIVDARTGVSGEMFLGYKDNTRVRKYLSEQIPEVFMQLKDSGLLCDINGRFFASYELLQSVKKGNRGE